MAEQHLYTYPSATLTQTGKEFIEGVQWLWTGGRSSVWSRAISLINDGEGIAVYATGDWTKTNTYTWPGGGGWDLTWVSDDGKTTIKSKQVESVYNKTQWKESGTHEILAANGDTYKSTFYYNSSHKLIANDVYIGGTYSGGHTISFKGKNGTLSDTSDDQLAEESNQWASKVAYDAKAVRSENIKSTNKLSYSDKRYEISWDSKIEQNWGVESQANPAYVKPDPSKQWVVKDIYFDTQSYKFKDKSTGFEFSFSTKDKINYVTNKADLNWTNVSIKTADFEIQGKTVKISNLTAEQVDKINFGNEIGEDLSGVESDITNIILPFVDLVKEETLKRDNTVKIKNTSRSEFDAGDGNDNIVGNIGSDTLTGGAGNDVVSAGGGNDLIVGGNGAGNDNYDGGAGIDLIRYSSATDAITVDLVKGIAKSTVGPDKAGIGSDKLKGIENIIAGSYGDMLIGSTDANNIDGGAGDDSIDGGLGKDTLIGGAGKDRFVFSTKLGATNFDTISDFVVGEDKLQLSSKIFAKLKGASNYLTLGSSSEGAKQFLIYDSGTGKLSYDEDGNGTKIKPVEVAFIGVGLSLTTSDIEIVS